MTVSTSNRTSDAFVAQILRERFTNGLIAKKAKQLARRGEFDAMDAEDIEQEIRVHLLKRLPQFDPDVAHWKQFVTSVVERFVRDMLRNHGCQKRGKQPPQSLSKSVSRPGERPCDVASALTESDGDTRRQISRRSVQDHSSLQHDIAMLLLTLPEQQRQMLELRKQHSNDEVARIMNVPRSTLQGWMTRVSVAFEQAGLREYLA